MDCLIALYVASPDLLLVAGYRTLGDVCEQSEVESWCQQADEMLKTLHKPKHLRRSFWELSEHLLGVKGILHATIMKIKYRERMFEGQGRMLRERVSELTKASLEPEARQHKRDRSIRLDSGDEQVVLPALTARLTPEMDPKRAAIGRARASTAAGGSRYRRAAPLQASHESYFGRSSQLMRYSQSLETKMASMEKRMQAKDEELALAQQTIADLRRELNHCKEREVQTAVQSWRQFDASIKRSGRVDGLSTQSQSEAILPEAKESSAELESMGSMGGCEGAFNLGDLRRFGIFPTATGSHEVPRRPPKQAAHQQRYHISR